MGIRRHITCTDEKTGIQKNEAILNVMLHLSQMQGLDLQIVYLLY